MFGGGGLGAADASQFSLSVCDQLPDPWAALCRLKQSLSFAWAHDGERAGGNWVELLPDGKLSTKWGAGSWERDEKEPLILKLIFGSCCHVCRLLVDEGKFKVEKRIGRRGGKVASAPKVKGVEVVSAGWPIDPTTHQSKQKSVEKSKPAEKTLQAKQKAAQVAEEKRKIAEEAAVAAAEAAADAAAKAKEMEKLAKKAEAAKSVAEERAQQASKEVEDALAEKKKAGPSMLDFITPLKRKKDAVEEEGSPPGQKRTRLGEIDSMKFSTDIANVSACTARNDTIDEKACLRELSLR